MSSIFDAFREDDGRKWDDLTVEERAEKNKKIIESLDSEMKQLKQRFNDLSYKLEQLRMEERQDEDVRNKFQKIEYTVQRNENNIKQLYKQLNLKMYY